LLASCSGAGSRAGGADGDVPQDPDAPSPDPRSGYVAVRGAGDSGAQFTGHGGRDVPAFMQMARMPPPLVPTSAPVMSGGAIDTSSDLAVAWTPLPFGDAVLTIGGPLPPEYGVEVV
jgi:hypothetical protein